MVTAELQELLTCMYVLYLYTQWELERRPGFNCACNRNRAILRLCTGAPQFRDCIKLVLNLETAQIPRLRGINTLVDWSTV